MNSPICDQSIKPAPGKKMPGTRLAREPGKTA
jgi:hypothetical protein